MESKSSNYRWKLFDENCVLFFRYSLNENCITTCQFRSFCQTLNSQLASQQHLTNHSMQPFYSRIITWTFVQYSHFHLHLRSPLTSTFTFNLIALIKWLTMVGRMADVPYYRSRKNIDDRGSGYREVLYNTH